MNLVSRIIAIFNVALSSMTFGIHLQTQTSEKKVIIVDHLNSIWTGEICKSFQVHLEKTKQKFRFITVTWGKEENPDRFAQEVLDMKPDIVFLPDEVIYKAIAKKISTNKNVHICTFFSACEEKEILGLPNESGVFNQYPSDQVLDLARKIFPVKKLAIIGGPLGEGAISLIKKPLQNKNVIVDSYVEKRWDSYKQRVSQIEKSYDAVWLLLPFGTLDQGNQWVDFQKMAPITEKLKIPSIGFGSIDKYARTITVGLVQEKIGEVCAMQAYLSVFMGQKPQIKRYQSYDIFINPVSVKNLGLKVPEGVAHFLRG